MKAVVARSVSEEVVVTGFLACGSGIRKHESSLTLSSKAGEQGLRL